MPDKEYIEALLEAVRKSDRRALPRLVELVYPDLKRIARFHLAGERPGHTLSTTAIVHEAYLRMATGSPIWNDHRHFLRAAALGMSVRTVEREWRRARDFLARAMEGEGS